MERSPMKSTLRRNEPYKMLKKEANPQDECLGSRRHKEKMQKKYPEEKGVLKRTDPLTIIAGLKAKAKAPKGHCIKMYNVERSLMHSTLRTKEHHEMFKKGKTTRSRKKSSVKACLRERP